MLHMPLIQVNHTPLEVDAAGGIEAHPVQALVRPRSEVNLGAVQPFLLKPGNRLVGASTRVVGAHHIVVLAKNGFSSAKELQMARLQDMAGPGDGGGIRQTGGDQSVGDEGLIVGNLNACVGRRLPKCASHRFRQRPVAIVDLMVEGGADAQPIAPPRFDHKGFTTVPVHQLTAVQAQLTLHGHFPSRLAPENATH